MKILTHKKVSLKKIFSLNSMPLMFDLIEILRNGNFFLQVKLFFQLKPKKFEAVWKLIQKCIQHHV